MPLSQNQLAVQIRCSEPWVNSGTLPFFKKASKCFDMLNTAATDVSLIITLSWYLDSDCQVDKLNEKCVSRCVKAFKELAYTNQEGKHLLPRGWFLGAAGWCNCLINDTTVFWNQWHEVWQKPFPESPQRKITDNLAITYEKSVFGGAEGNHFGEELLIYLFKNPQTKYIIFII